MTWKKQNQNKMKIYIVGRAFPEKKTGMSGLFEFQQAKALSDVGNEIHYIYVDSRSIKVNRFIKRIEKEIEYVKIHGFNIPIGGIPEPIFSTIKSFFYQRLLNQVFEKYGYPDVIHIHFPLLSITPKVWKSLFEIRNKNVSLVCTEHWSKVNNNKLSKRNIDFLKKIYQETDTFVTVSDDLKNSVQSICGGTREVIVIPNMVNKFFCYKEKNEKRDFHFVSVGRLVEIKRFGFLIDTFSKEFQNDKNVYLDIVGGGPLFDSLEKKIEMLHMQRQISLIGYKKNEEIAELFHNSDAYVSTSLSETFCVPIAEAWMSGLPVIAADNIPLRNYFSDKNGILFSLNNIDNLAFCLRHVVNNKDNYEPNEIAEKMSEHFSTNSVVNKLTEIYKESK